MSLKTVRSRLTPAGRRLAPPDRDRDYDKRRTAELDYRSWYKTADWQRLRWSTLKRDNFTCQICGRVEMQTRELTADHRTPHRGDAGLFWDPENLQTLCKPCHDGTKQRQERAAKGGGGSISGGGRA